MNKSIFAAIDAAFDSHISAFFWDRRPVIIYLDEIVIGG